MTSEETRAKSRKEENPNVRIHPSVQNLTDVVICNQRTQTQAQRCQTDVKQGNFIPLEQEQTGKAEASRKCKSKEQAELERAKNTRKYGKKKDGKTLKQKERSCPTSPTRS